jgi:hypothetical protein
VAGPSVSVRILGDTKGFSQSVKDTGAEVEKSSGRMHRAFSTVLESINRTGVFGPFGEALASVDESFASLAGHGRSVGAAMVGLGTTFAGIGVGLAALGSKDQAARQQLQASVEATGSAWDDYSSKVEEAIKHNERFGDTANVTENSLQILTQATGSPQVALKLLSTATDLAAAKHESLTDAATQLGKVYNGNTKLLKQFGINIASATAATKAAETATRRADTADRALAAAKDHLNNVEAIDATRKKLTATQALSLQSAEQKVTEATTAATKAHQTAAAAQDTATAATKNQAGAVDQLGQKLQGQAIAKSDTFLGKVKAVTTSLEDQAAAFGNKYGPALGVASEAVAVLGAAYSGAKGLIDKHAASVKAASAAGEDGAKKAGVFSKAIRAIIPATEAAGTSILAFGAIVTAVLLLAVAYGYLLYRNWGIVWPQLKQWAKDVFDYIHYSWNNLITDFKAVPGQIASIASGMWKPIANAFVDVINYIIHVWNSLQFRLPSVSAFGVTIGGETFGVPTIPDVPHLAQGGLITQTGLVFAHAGEAITPAPGRTSPAVAIENAHFSAPVDVDLFASRLAWILRTQRA